MLSYSDVEREVFLQAVDVEKVMTPGVQIALPDESVVHAAKRMVKAKIGCLPVVNEDGDLLGLITETDVMRHFVETAPEEES